jgi:DNA replication protein DnaC
MADVRPLGAVMGQSLTELRRKTPSSTILNSGEQSTLPGPPLGECPRCKGRKFLAVTNENGLQSKVVPCDCQQGQVDDRQRQALEAIDGLKAAERAITFESILKPKTHLLAYNAVRRVLTAGAGIVTLTGAPGVGKTWMMIAAVNYARERGWGAVYITMTALLQRLRGTYDDDSKRSFDELWDMLVGVRVLALDEIDDWAATDWAKQWFKALIDERYRLADEKVTLCATNAQIADIIEKVASRLADRRNTVVEITGADLRQPGKGTPKGKAGK